MVQNLEQHEDLRVRRTRKMIQDAMIALTVEKGFNAVTVGDIAERAMINRSTFYRHYVDKCDLMMQYMADVNALVYEDDASMKAEPQWDELPAGLYKLLRHIQQHADFYRVMFGKKGDPEFTADFRKMIEKRFRFLITHFGETESPNGMPLELRLQHISHANIGVILWWLENDQPCSIEQLTKWISQLSSEAGLRHKPSN